MCGIFGRVNFGETSVTEKELKKMGDQMWYRGPDGHGSHIHKNVGIGMRRLSIIDVEKSHQPLTNEEGSIHLVFNGEIYNYREIREKLILKGHFFRTQGDGEVILHLYEELGFDCLNELEGMFALAIYDQKKDILWVARDRIGIKPLFYLTTKKSFVFSSDLKSITAVEPQEINKESVFSYLAFSYIPEPQTIYQNIFKLEAGSQLLIKGRHLEKTKYWALHPTSGKFDSLRGVTSTLDALISTSVQKHMISDVPVGLMLSGGLDSSALLSYTSKLQSEQKIKTFTINFEGKFGEDTSFASQVSNMFDTEHHVLDISFSDQVSALDELIDRLDEPIADSALIPTFLISKAARSMGIKVLLTGAGGDEIFGGYARHFSGVFGSASWIAGSNLRRGLFHLLTKKSHPHLSRRFQSAAVNYGSMISGINLQFFSEVFTNKNDLQKIIKELEHAFSDTISQSPRIKMKVDLMHYLPNNVLALTDKAMMAASVEGRVPLLDHHVVEYCFALDDSLNPLNLKEKGLLKSLMRSVLPEDLIKRKKEGFNAPVRSWVDSCPEMIRKEIINNPTEMFSDIFDIGSLEKWLSSSQNLKSAGQSLYSLFVLNKWLRRHQY